MKYRPILLLALVVLSGCAHHRKLPVYEKPLARANTQSVRTTAYTHTEADHKKYGAKNALGTTLKTGEINSAAADWSRWPGTQFQIRETGQVFEVDDYGWSLTGRNTIDLYMPTRRAMNEWGVQRVTIDILQWGDTAESYRLLKQRKKYRHCAFMVREIEGRVH